MTSKLEELFSLSKNLDWLFGPVGWSVTSTPSTTSMTNNEARRILLPQRITDNGAILCCSLLLLRIAYIAIASLSS